MSDQELIRIDDNALEAAVSQLNGYIRDLETENVSLNYINKQVVNYWNEGSTADVMDYSRILNDNILTIDSKIIPTLRDYVNTMINLIQDIRAAERRAIERARQAARESVVSNSNGNILSTK